MDNTYRCIKTKFFWRGMYDEVQIYVRSCRSCQYVAPKSKRAASQLKPIAPPHECWNLIGVDLQGPFVETERGNTYLAVVKDYLSKFSIVRPITDKRGETVALELYKIFCDFGFVAAIIHDQGYEFLNEVIYY
jgi:hypothetical protein